MNVYRIYPPHGRALCVVAKTMGRAEELVKEKYRDACLEEIKLISEHVIIDKEENDVSR